LNMAKSPQKMGVRSEYRNENSVETPQCGAQCFDELFAEPELAVNIRRSCGRWLAQAWVEYHTWSSPPRSRNGRSMCQRALVVPGANGEGRSDTWLYAAIRVRSALWSVCPKHGPDGWMLAFPLLDNRVAISYHLDNGG